MLEGLIQGHFLEPVIPADVSSPNFSKIFGTNTNAFELLVMKRKIMGPCWIQVKNPQVEHKGVSYIYPHTSRFVLYARTGILVSIRSYGRRSEGLQPLLRVGRRCAQGGSSFDHCQPEHTYRHQSPGEQPRDCLRFGPYLVKQYVLFFSVRVRVLRLMGKSTSQHR